MEPATFYTEGSRALQRRFATEDLADHLARTYVLGELEPAHEEWIRRADAVHLATVDPTGQPDCSYKGGVPGFVRVPDPRTLEIPHYDGNGMYRTLGNVVGSGHIALLFVAPHQAGKLRVHGVAEVSTDPDVVAAHHGAEAVLTVRVTAVFENCPRYLHDTSGRPSTHCPRPGHEPPNPAWKLKPEYEALLPPGARPSHHIPPEDQP